MKRGSRFALLLVVAAAMASTALYLSQGGFGAGHGRFDLPIYLLGLPWDFAIEQLNASILEERDYEWLIVLPLVLNVATILLLDRIRNRLGRRRRTIS
jgi:hypothetical protein